MDPYEQYAEQYRDLNDDTLFAMLEEARDYDEVAVRAMRSVLAERGLEAALPEPVCTRDMTRRADELADGGKWRMLVGAIFLCISLFAIVVSRGAVLFIGLAGAGIYYLTRGTEMKGAAERIDNELRMIAAEETERSQGLLSIAEQASGAVSIAQPPNSRETN